MKILLSLLKNYVDIDNLSAKDISDILTSAGIEVENIENEFATFSGVVSALVEDVNPHPNADKLKIATVFDGTNRYQVVCGASNCKKDMKTAFAKIGATLKTEEEKPIQISKCKLRDVESFGMLCSKKELKLGGDEGGIIELPKETELGLDLSKTLVDPVLDISLTPNLGHCMHVLGIARELAALTNKKVKYPNEHFEAKKELSARKKINIDVADKTLCPRYSALYVENIEVGPSPSFLKNYLESCSIRSINNIVDIMNFVMLEMGQPVHAFDYDKLDKQSIMVCPLKKEEKFIGLDGLERKVPKDSLVIKDGEKIVAIAGIIGGENSAVSDSTKNILIESAYFQPLSIRKTSRHLVLRTESSLRFEKNIDPNGTIIALKRIAHLIKMSCPKSQISSDFVDIKELSFEKQKIKYRLSRINKILGTNLSLNEAVDIFSRLEIESKKISDDILEAIVPTYRNDLKLEIDLIEEIARIYGYNNIEKKAPLFSSSSIANAPLYTFESLMKKILTSQGMQEWITCDLISPKLSKLIEDRSIPKSAIIEVLHAKSAEQTILRASMLPSFLQVVKHNLDHKNMNISAFEVGKIHFKKDDDYVEQPTTALVLSGKNRPHHFSEKGSDFDFFDLKGIIENIFQSLKINNWSVTKSAYPCFHPSKQAAIFIDNIEIGAMGEIHPLLLAEMDIKKAVLFAEVNNLFLLNHQKTDVKYKELPQFPSSERDWTITIAEDTDLSSILKKIKSNILEEVFILDIYSDPKSKSSDKNVTLRFVYRDKAKTVLFEEVEKEHSKLTNEIAKKLKD